MHWSSSKEEKALQLLELPRYLLGNAEVIYSTCLDRDFLLWNTTDAISHLICLIKRNVRLWY